MQRVDQLRVIVAFGQLDRSRRMRATIGCLRVGGGILRYWPQCGRPDRLPRSAGAFTHVSERAARVTDLGVSVCAVLLAEACKTGLEPLVRHETQSLRRDRLSWVSQNYLRDETLRAANARLVAAQTGIPLARA